VAQALGANAPQTTAEPDRTPPTPFALLRPRNRRHLRHNRLRFVWQRSRDAGGIRDYKLYMNGRPVRTVRDKDGPGGRDPKPHVVARISGGRHRWFVRAYDYAGNHRTSRSFRRGRYSKSSVLFVRKRHPKKVVAHLARPRSDL
jgi:hypothetical protein